MLIFKPFAVCLAISLASTAALAAEPSADDFLPPVKGGPTDVQQPDEVEAEGPVVEAATAQDAMNAAKEQVKAELTGDADTPETGYRFTSFPSGAGLLAGGMATYDTTMPNRDAVMVAKRKAYVKAFVEAKSNMVKARKGLQSEGSEAVRDKLTTVVTAEETLNNASLGVDERLEQAASGIIRGFVTYEVKDEEIADAPGQRVVYVVLASTPKTAGATQRTAPGVIDAKSLREGLDAVIQEVRAGIVPPVGGRIVTVADSDEIAVIGFGSAVVFGDKNPAVKAKLTLKAQKIAIMRAQDALCGMLVGDAVSWQGGVTDAMADDNRGFEEALAGDPTAQADPATAKALAREQKAFAARDELTEVFASARKGLLPPGLSPKSWFDEEGDTAYAMCVYVPSATNAAAELDRALEESSLQQPIDDGSAGGGESGDGEAGGGQKRKGKATGKPVQPGPTGKVTADDDL